MTDILRDIRSDMSVTPSEIVAARTEYAEEMKNIFLHPKTISDRLAGFDAAAEFILIALAGELRGEQ